MRPTPAALVLALSLAAALSAEDKATAPAKPVLDPPTTRCLGVYWIIAGDDDADATVALRYRAAGSKEWMDAMPLFRVAREAPHTKGDPVSVPAGSWLFAGSVIGLAEDTAYELKVSLSDPDGGAAEEVVAARTTHEPVVAERAPRRHVVPGAGGGTGTKEDPFKGFAAAEAAAQPGDVLLLHQGHYGSVEVAKSGEPGKPIVWQGAGDGVASFGGGSEQAAVERGLTLENKHDVWFENIAVAHADWGIVANDCSRLLLRRSHLFDVRVRGFTFCKNRSGTSEGFWISDNLIEGTATWPRDKDKGEGGIEDKNGIHGTGAGHEICYNRVRGFADGIDSFESPRCVSWDVHHNEISETTDDGIEMDGGQRNCRCWQNRITNCFQGISVQPVYGGPIYIVRNAIYNIEVEPFKMHQQPWGAVMLHNTIVKKDNPELVWTPKPSHHCVFRNNLFIGSGGTGMDFDTRMDACDFDYDGIGGFSGPLLKWNNVKYGTIEELRANSPAEKHLTVVDPATAFAGGAAVPADPHVAAPLAVNDLRLKPGSAAIDAGVVLANIDDGFAGKAPDLGAYELGDELPHYGPRPEGGDAPGGAKRARTAAKPVAKPVPRPAQ